jgi:hypothetical protein
VKMAMMTGRMIENGIMPSV